MKTFSGSKYQAYLPVDFKGFLWQWCHGIWLIMKLFALPTQISDVIDVAIFQTDLLTFSITHLQMLP